MSKRNLGYSPLSAIDRQIVDAKQFDDFFQKTNNERKLISKNLSTRQTVLKMIDIINSKSFQTRKIANYLQAETTYETCKNIWEFCYNYIKYQKDIQRNFIIQNAISCIQLNYNAVF